MINKELAVIKEQLLWELNGVRQLVYSSGLGNRVAVLKETRIRVHDTESSTGIFQLRCLAKQVAYVLEIFNKEAGEKLHLSGERHLATAAWIDYVEKALLQEEVIDTTALVETTEYAIGMSRVTVGRSTLLDRAKWFAMPSIAFHKTLVYVALTNAGYIGLGKLQAFGYSVSTIDTKRNKQIDWEPQ